jgi:hypothetical protein
VPVLPRFRRRRRRRKQAKRLVRLFLGAVLAGRKLRLMGAAEIRML